PCVIAAALTAGVACALVVSPAAALRCAVASASVSERKSMQCSTGLPHPCRQCLSCRINARRIWVARLMLEARCHEHSVFSTLTYAKEPSDASVHQSHLSSTIHRLRDRCRRVGASVRFFGVGEYGERLGRPHYHAAIFGLPGGDTSLVDDAWSGLSDRDFSSEPGFCHHGALTPDSASYLAGYVTKKLTARASADALASLGGRSPEFAVMSRRPGIGMLGIEALIEGLNTNAGALFMARTGDVPVSLTIEGRNLPLGRTVRDHLRVFFFGESGQPASAKAAYERRFNESLSFVPSDASPVVRARLLAAFADQATDAHKAHFSQLGQRGKQVAARHRISLSKRTL
ncbi:replication initiator protein, partial [Apis mellifera associated microvirus 47]